MRAGVRKTLEVFVAIQVRDDGSLTQASSCKKNGEILDIF